MKSKKYLTTNKKHKSSKKPSRLLIPGVKTNVKKRRKLPLWKRLKHNGPLFPDSYKRLPKDVKLLYKGRKLHLSKNAEEAATLYAKVIREKICRQKEFRKNFFDDWKKVMSTAEVKKIKDFGKCNFEKIHQHLQEKASLKRQRSKKNKLLLLKKKGDQQKKYGTCIVDEEKQNIANYKIEPPSIFRGRGKNRLLGRIKPRVLPKDVTINIGKRERIPKPSTAGSWKEVIHDNHLAWLASWMDQITNKRKYIYTGPASHIKVSNDIEKFEMARNLEVYISGIRRNYQNGCRSEDLHKKQRSLALFFIDKLALRAGNETGPLSSETFGCCSLLKKHIKLNSRGRNYSINLKFKSKDSIDFIKKVDVPKIIHKALQDCIKGKRENEQILDLINPSELNSYLYSIDRKLTAKVFRTYNSSKLFEKTLISETLDTMTMEEKLLCLDKAYIAVAELCNHKKTVPVTRKRMMKKLSNRINASKRKIEDLEIDEEESEDNSRIVERLEKEREKLFKLTIHQRRKELTADWNLSTGKQNYLDPRILVAWAKKFHVPMNKVFTPVQRRKFDWAMKTNSSFVF